ncbi:eCIS core domain-containing protein [Sinomicrobium sp. M5D2P17]
MQAFAKKSGITTNPASSNKGREDFFGVQAKLSVGKADDKYEREADHNADKVVQKLDNPLQHQNHTPFFAASPVVQKKESQDEKELKIQEKPIVESITPLVQKQSQEEQVQEKEEEEIQKQEEEQSLQKQSQADDGNTDENTKVQAKADRLTTAPPKMEHNLRHSSGGQAMNGITRSQMESGFGTDFGNVKIHTDHKAVQMNQKLGAQAFTHGNDIYFNEGKYNPSSRSGKHLLAHELTHTVQQGKGELIQRKSEKPESKIEDEINKELPNNKVGVPSQKDNLKRNAPDQNKEVKSTDIINDLSSLSDNKQPKQLDEKAKNLSQNKANSSNGVLNQGQIAPIDEQPNQSQLKKTKESAEKNMQASLSETKKKDQKPGKQPNKKGKVKTNKKTGIKSTVERGQSKSNNDTTGVSAISLNTDLPKISNTRSIGSKVLLTKINESYLQLQQQFLDRYAEKKESLSAFVTLQQQDLTDTGISIEARITNAITNARTIIINNIATSQGQISSHRVGQDGILTGSENSSTTNVATIFTTGQTDITNEANTLANRSVQTANDSANQLQTNVTQSVNEAYNVGERKANVNDSDTGVRSAKQRTAREIAADSSEKIAGGRADAEQKIRSTGPMASEEFQKQGREAASQLILGKSQVDGEILNIFSNAKVGVKSIEESSDQSLQQTQAQLLDQLVDLEIKLLQQLKKEIDKKIADLHKAEQQTMSLFDEQTQQALTKSKMQLQNNNSEIAAANISEQKVDEAHALVVHDMSGGFNSLQLSFENSAQEATNQLAQQNTELRGNLGNTQSVILSQIDVFSSSAQTQIDQSKGNTITQLSEATGQAVSGSNQIVGQVDTNIKQQVQTINQNFTSGFVDFEGNLGTQVNEATQEARTPLRDLNSRIDEGQTRAATRAERSWLSNQFHDAVEMLSSPGFWAGLIVGLLLTIVFLLLIAGTALTGGALLAVLVVGFAVIGGVAAAVGSVVNQATNGSFTGGWDWSRVDWGQVGMAALFGAAAGAVFAVVAFVAVEVFSVAVASWTFVAIMSVTAGVVTVITNLINGQPWDKDLLINMTIAGFFAWLARFLPGGKGRPTEEVPSDTPEPIPGRPSEPDGPERVPPETEVPVPIRPGQEIIIDDVSRLSYTDVTSNGSKNTWNLYDTETGARFTHYVKATPETGPDMFLDPQNALIPGVGRVKLVAEGFKWTPEANRLNMEAYEALYGHRPPNLNGQIWASNLDRFVINYDQVRAQNPSLSRQAIADTAIRDTSFGQGKIEQGYGDLRVVMDGVEFRDVTIYNKKTDTYTTYRDVPRNDVAIDVIAEPDSQ